MRRKRKRNGAPKARDKDIVHKDKDLRIPGATPHDVARALLKGGAAPRPETALKPA